MFKRGQVETPINWIFVLMAGSVILLFFAIVIYRIQGTVEKQASATLITSLNSIFSGMGLSSDTSAVIPNLPNSELFFNCQGYSSGDLTGGFEERLTFAPSTLNIQPLIVWSMPWNMPFFISNFLFITTSNIKYVFVHDEAGASNSLKLKIEALLSEHITKQFVKSSSSLQEEGTITKFIFLNMDPESLHPSFINLRVNALKINANGVVSFYEKLPGVNKFELKLNPSSVFFDDATLIASIMVDNAEYYECMLSKAIKRYEQLAYIISERVSSLKSLVPVCNQRYNPAASNLYSFLSSTSFIEEKEEDVLSYLNNIKTLINQIKANNEELPLHSCPPIY